LPNFIITTERPRYACLDSRRGYPYESVDSDFKRKIEVDANELSPSTQNN